MKKVGPRYAEVRTTSKCMLNNKKLECFIDVINKSIRLKTNSSLRSHREMKYSNLEGFRALKLLKSLEFEDPKTLQSRDWIYMIFALIFFAMNVSKVTSKD